MFYKRRQVASESNELMSDLKRTAFSGSVRFIIINITCVNHSQFSNNHFDYNIYIKDVSQ